ncbi:unnamed protein product [Toxocara canis]|uniref:NADH dehydrogenase (Ubiquinone) complex I, assembly factor 6 n=1 Tax=Toxocara canis TaxID=6265 RepID=A0A183VCD2_TOXCA|nr:unnamed protein product [Toxocara canis]
MEALNHCVALTRKRDFANYVGALLMPTEVQPAVFALLAFNVELAIIRDQIERNSGTTGIYRLQFWKDTIEAIYGDGGGPVPKQPVAVALERFVSNVDLSLLSSLVSARQQTLGDRPFRSVDAVQQYGVNTYGALMKLLMRVLAQKRERVMHALGNHVHVAINDKVIEAVDLLAGAMALVTLLRWSSIPLLSRGIVLLPDDLMQLHGLSADSFYGMTKPEAVKSLARDITMLSSSLLDRSRALRDEVPCVVRVALISSGATVQHLVRILRKCDYNLFDARLQRGASLLAWRLWWRSILGWY